MDVGAEPTPSLRFALRCRRSWECPLHYVRLPPACQPTTHQRRFYYHGRGAFDSPGPAAQLRVAGQLWVASAHFRMRRGPVWMACRTSVGRSPSVALPFAPTAPALRAYCAQGSRRRTPARSLGGAALRCGWCDCARACVCLSRSPLARARWHQSRSVVRSSPKRSPRARQPSFSPS